jgi:uncharacterized protein YlzI (FlbEa/FlbD family)
MNNFQPPNSQIVAQSTQSIQSIDEWKSFFYQLNAKPDTEIRLLKGDKILSLADIRSVKEQITAKLSNHEITTDVVSINFVLSHQKIKNYSSWREFEKENWETVNEKILSISISWDILIKLPKYEVPQRHSLKIRIGNPIPPKDFFQLMLTSDDISELIEIDSPSVCKVDFVNNILANELLNIIATWFEGLKNCPDSGLFEKLIKRQGKYVSEFIRHIMPVLFLFVFNQYSNYLYSLLSISQELSIENFQTMAIVFTFIIVCGWYAGKRIEHSMDRIIDKLEDYPRFTISRGDKNAVEEFESKNQKLTSQIMIRVIMTIFVTPVSLCVKLLINYIIQ